MKISNYTQTNKNSSGLLQASPSQRRSAAACQASPSDDAVCVARHPIFVEKNKSITFEYKINRRKGKEKITYRCEGEA